MPSNTKSMLTHETLGLVGGWVGGGGGEEATFYLLHCIWVCSILSS